MAIFRLLRENWQSGLTVALVSVPLSVSLAIATNATPVMGIITAVWAGLVASIFGGSRFNILGPAAALSGVLASYALTYGPASLPWVAVCAGGLVLVAWALRWDTYIAFIPGSVIHGFTLAIAMIIALNQLNFALGLSGLPPHEAFVENLLETVRHAGALHVPTAAVFAGCLAALFLWQRLVPRVPGPIPLAVVGIVLGALSSAGAGVDGLQTLATRYGAIDASLMHVPVFSMSMINRPFLATTATVAVIAILETLLSAKVADGMTRTKFDRRREMFALGLANIASGIVGGLPATGVFARTAINIRSGATHRISQGVNAVAVAVICYFFLPQFRHLPLAVVAAILVFSATRMIQREHFTRLYRHDRVGFGLAMAVAVLSVAFDPMIGILVGAAAALLFFVRTMAKGQAEVTINREGVIAGRMSSASFLRNRPSQGDVFVYRFAGPLTYVNAQAHLQALDVLREPKVVILAFRNLFFVDCDGVDAVVDMVEMLEGKGMRVAFSGVSELIEPYVRPLDCYRKKLREGLVFTSTSEAVKQLGKGER
jgi:SulP family sulfate permease